MEYVELAIKIPKEVYERFEYEYIEEYDASDYITEVILDACTKGIVIPKGHGRLKDVDAIMSELSVVSSRPVKSQMYMIEQAPTLIEADKVERGGE